MPGGWSRSSIARRLCIIGPTSWPMRRASAAAPGWMDCVLNAMEAAIAFTAARHWPNSSCSSRARWRRSASCKPINRRVSSSRSAVLRASTSDRRLKDSAMRSSSSVPQGTRRAPTAPCPRFSRASTRELSGRNSRRSPKQRRSHIAATVVPPSAASGATRSQAWRGLMARVGLDRHGPMTRARDPHVAPHRRAPGEQCGEPRGGRLRIEVAADAMALECLFIEAEQARTLAGSRRTLEQRADGPEGALAAAQHLLRLDLVSDMRGSALGPLGQVGLPRLIRADHDDGDRSGEAEQCGGRNSQHQRGSQLHRRSLAPCGNALRN